MDSSKILPGSEECSSSESGWTTYIASPDLQHDYAENEDDDDDDDEDGNIAQKGYKKVVQEEEEAAAADSDDSMASDASSGPSDQRYSYGYHARNRGGFSHAGSKNERKSVAKKHNQQEEKKKKQIKGEKDKSGNSAGRLKKF